MKIFILFELFRPEFLPRHVRKWQKKKNTAEVSYSLALAELKYARAQLNSLQAELKSAQAEQKSRLTSLYVEELNLCSIKSSSRAKIQLRQKKKIYGSV